MRADLQNRILAVSRLTSSRDSQVELEQSRLIWNRLALCNGIREVRGHVPSEIIRNFEVFKLLEMHSNCKSYHHHLVIIMYHFTPRAHPPPPLPSLPMGSFFHPHRFKTEPSGLKSLNQIRTNRTFMVGWC